MLCDEHARIPIQAWFFSLWRLKAVFVDQAAVRQGSWRSRSANLLPLFAAQAAFHVAAVQGLDPHRSLTASGGPFYGYI